MKRLDGKSLASQIFHDLKKHVQALDSKGVPTLAVLLIGDHLASATYVRIKKKRCQEVGIQSKLISLPTTTTEKALIAVISELNDDPTVHGILVQQPLPHHVCPQRVAEAVSPAKDVDGLHPLNVGKLLTAQTNGFIPCTPLGIVRLLQAYAIPTKGKHIVILGRSIIVGKPLAALLVQKTPGCDATVTLAHRATTHLPELCRSADILIAAMGCPHFVQREMVQPGAVIIDVGINRMKDPHGRSCLTGDVDVASVAPLCSAITPVPGGVGPMTVAMLLSNTLKSCQKTS